jgi:two-component system sensor histidine kinase QseC
MLHNIQRPSLQSRLLSSLMVVTAVAWLLVLGLTWYETDHELNELLDAHLAQTASFLVSQSGDGHEAHTDFTASPTLHKYQPRVAFQIWHEGELLARSEKAPELPFRNDGQSGLTDRNVDGQVWRIFSTQGQEKDMWIHVAELGKYRQDILYAGLESAIVPLLLVFPLLALFIWWSIRVSLGPLRHLGQEIGLRHASSLQPLAEETAVKEVQPLVQALNQLFKRVETQMVNERQFTSDAAHELRTPVAAIRMQAQVAMGASEPGVQYQAMQAVLEGCDRATRLISQLLELSRLDAAERHDEVTSAVAIDVISLTRQQLAESGYAWIAKNQTLDFDAPESLLLQMKPEWLSIVVRNLIDNASRYSPEGSRLQVSWQTEPQPRLIVEDSGPGMTASNRARLGDRFFRVLGNEASGSGLGWSIVRRIAQLNHITIELGNSPALGGLQVVLAWPKACDRGLAPDAHGPEA